MKSKIALALLLTSAVVGQVMGSTQGAVNPTQEKEIFTPSSDKSSSDKMNASKYYLWIDKKKVKVSDFSHFSKLKEAFVAVGIIDKAEALDINDPRLYDASTVALVDTKSSEMTAAHPHKKEEIDKAKNFIINEHFSKLYYQRGPIVSKIDKRIYDTVSIKKDDKGRIINEGRQGLLRTKASANTEEIYQALEECKLGRAQLEKQIGELRKEFESKLALKDKKLHIGDLEKSILEIVELLKKKKAELRELDPDNALAKDDVKPKVNVSTETVDLLDTDSLDTTLKPKDSINVSTELAEVSKGDELRKSVITNKAALKLQRNFRANKEIKKAKSVLQVEILEGTEAMDLEKAIQLLLPFEKKVEELSANDLNIANVERNNLLEQNKEHQDKIQKINNAYQTLELQIGKKKDVDTASSTNSLGLGQSGVNSTQPSSLNDYDTRSKAKEKTVVPQPSLFTTQSEGAGKGKQAFKGLLNGGGLGDENMNPNRSETSLQTN